MMRKIKMITITMLLLLTTVAMAQGISFEQDLSWKQVLAKARKENRYIFVDAMATWCIPCKKMDKEVYLDEALGSFANERFVSVKVQMDSTKKDSKHIMSWYADAKAIMKKYGVNAFPSYLFFSPEGKIVHMGGGLMDIGSFKALMTDAIDPNKQEYGKYYALLEDYHKGKKDYEALPFMVEMSKKLKNKKLEQKLALDYIHNYLLKLGEKELYTEKNILFISSYVSSKDRAVFGMFYPDGSRADKIVKRISEIVLSNVISKEEINERIVKNNDYKDPKVDSPDWSKLAIEIKKKYNVDGGKRINSAKRKWYAQTKPNANKMAEAVVELLTVYMPIAKMDYWLEPHSANNALYYDVAVGATDKSILLRAAKIQKEVINKFVELRKKIRPNNDVKIAAMLDTYAILLYKSGESKEAIFWMQKALDEKPQNKELMQHMAQMKEGRPLNLKSRGQI